MEQGRFDDHLEVHESRFIQGAVTQGATVRAGGRLIVQGAVAGPLVIEERGALAVQGTLDCRDLRNAGVITVAGVVTGELPADGMVLVAPGTLFAGEGRVEVLRDDGSLDPVAGHVDNLVINAEEPKFRLMPDGTFVRTDQD